MMKNKKEEEGKEKEVQSKTQEEAICRKKFKWPKKLQDPNPVIKDKQVKTEITFLLIRWAKILQLGDVRYWWGGEKDTTVLFIYLFLINLHNLSRVQLGNVYQSLKCFYPQT